MFNPPPISCNKTFCKIFCLKNIYSTIIQNSYNQTNIASGGSESFSGVGRGGATQHFATYSEKIANFSIFHSLLDVMVDISMKSLICLESRSSSEAKMKIFRYLMIKRSKN